MREPPKGKLTMAQLRERIEGLQWAIKDLRKRLKKGLKPVAYDGGLPVRWIPEHVAAQEQAFKNLAYAWASKLRELKREYKLRSPDNLYNKDL